MTLRRQCRVWMILPLAWALPCPAAARLDGREATVVTTDGRRITGSVSAGVKLTVVRDPVRHTYLSGAIVSGTLLAGGAAAPAEYVLNEELVKCPKKGKVAPVVTKPTWGRPRADGTMPVTLTDPKLGRISYRLAVTRITPTLCHLEGVEYEHRLAFPTKSLAGIAIPIVVRSVNLKDRASLRTAARFFRDYGDARRAQYYLRALKRLAPQDKAVDAEFARLELTTILRRFEAARSLARGGRRAEAARIMQAIAIPPGLAEFAGREAGEIADLKKTLAAETRALADAKTLLAAGGVTLEDLSGGQALRLVRILRPGRADAPKVPAKYYPFLAKLWAEPFTRIRPTEAALDEAIGLADRVAKFFAAGRIDEAPPVASALIRSKLPMELKLAIFTHAHAYTKPAEPVRWTRQEYLHPTARQRFHYYVQLPPNYHPRRPWPALIALHGQKSTAEVMRAAWGRRAAANGIVLLSPEYIYRRKWGYRFSAEEQHAVLGALWHAAGMFHIDMDRVYLTGVSQGGHACWDIGSARAGRFAGVVPIIGAERLRHTHFNFRSSAVYAVDGSADGLAPRMNREMIQRLASADCDATYVEYVGRGHEGFWEEYAAIIDWMFRHRRDVAAREVHLVATRNCELRRKWIHLLATRPALPSRRSADGKPCADVRARWADNTVTIEASGVGRLGVLLVPGLVDFDRPVTIRIGERKVYRRRVRRDWLFALQQACRSRDRRAVYLGQIAVRVPPSNRQVQPAQI